MQDLVLEAIAFFGSACAAAFIAAASTSSLPGVAPRYGLVPVDARACLADTAGDVLVAVDNVPACLPEAAQQGASSR